MDLTRVFAAIGNQMLTDFELAQSQIKHLGERGGEREAVLRSFLESYLPSRYGVSSGEIIDVSGVTSPQCDVIIYDHLNCPLLLAGKDYRVFPAESVLAVIEVKSILTLAQLKDAVNKIRSVKSLRRRGGPIVGVVFAYKSAVSKDPMQKVASWIQGLNAALSPHEYVDLLCVLDSGLIYLFGEEGVLIPEEVSDRLMAVWYQLSLPVLLWFFINLLSFLDTQETTRPFYFDYVRVSQLSHIAVWYPSGTGGEEWQKEWPPRSQFSGGRPDCDEPK